MIVIDAIFAFVGWLFAHLLVIAAGVITWKVMGTPHLSDTAPQLYYLAVAVWFVICYVAFDKRGARG